MPRITITELWLKHAHNRVDRPTEFTHDGVDFEFGVVVNPPSTRYPKGTKSFFTRYQYGGSKRGRKQTLGRYPTMKLSAALEEAKEVQRKADRGVDPRKTRAALPQERTFGELFAQYFEKRSLKKARPKTDRYVVHKYLSEWIDRPVCEITRQFARETFRAIHDGGARAQCNLVQYLVSAIFNWALDEGHVEKNPVHRLPLQGEIRSRERFLSDDEIKKLLPALRERGDWTADVLHLMLLTGQRNAEVLKMRYSKILDGCWWLLPGKIELQDGRVIPGTKNKKTHLCYLTPAALAVVDNRRRERPDSTDWVFPKPSDPSTFLDSPRRLYEVLKELRGVVGSDDWNPHDLRRTFVTNLSRLGCPREIRMAIVNHTSNHVHDRVYDMWEHAEQKMHWMTRWAEFLEAIENDATASFLPYAAPQISSSVSASS